MANSKLSILDFLGTAYDIDALFLGGVAADKFARRDTNNSFTVCSEKKRSISFLLISSLIQRPNFP